MLEQLQVLGLSRNESEVYEALVKSGQCKAGHLIARLDVHRNIVYEALDSMIRKGFVAKISKRGVWWFQITEPDSILTMLKRREEIAANVIQEIKQFQKQGEQQITVYEGIDSYRAYWVSSLERIPDGTIEYTLGIPSRSVWPKLMGEAALRKYMALRKKKNIFWKTIFFKFTDEEKKIMSIHPELNEYRLWPKDIEPIGNFNVVHDTIIVQVMKEPSPRIIEIRDKDLVTVFQNYFDAVWEEAVPIEV